MMGAGAALLVLIVAWTFSDSDEDAPSAKGEQETEGSSNESAKENDNEVRVEISTVPADAKLFLDGKALDNPFSGVFAKTPDYHELLVTRDGYKDERRKMLFSASQTVVIPLSEDSSLQEKKPVAGASKSGKDADAKVAPGAESGTQSTNEGRPARSSSSRSDSGSNSRSHTPPKPIRDLERGLKKLF